MPRTLSLFWLLVSLGSAAKAIPSTLSEPILPPEILSFTADDAYVSSGTTIALSWTTQDGDGFSIAPDIGDVSGFTSNGVGSMMLIPTSNTTYTLTVTNVSGSASADLRIGVGPPRPNILFFLVDDMGWQDTSVPFHHDVAGAPIVSELNDRYITPNMQLLADKSMKFTQAYFSPVCTPSRVSIMTGMNATRHHVTTWTHAFTPQDTGTNDIPHLDDPTAWRRAGMDATDIPLPSLLQQQGFRTIHAGKAHFGTNGTFAGDPSDIGFDVNIAGHGAGYPGSYRGTENFGSGGDQVPGLEAYHGQPIFLTEALTLEMNLAISDAVSDGVPFFAYMSHYAVHAPFTEDARFSSNYPALTGGAKAYATMIEGIDKSLGDILSHIQSLGEAENTLVVFVSDNGGDAPISAGNTPLRGKKGNRHEGGQRVPMMIGWAETRASNQFQQSLSIPLDSRCDDIVVGYDLFPTLLGLSGGSVQHEIDGVDLRPYLLGQPGPHRVQEFVVHFPHGHRHDHYATIRQGDWKLIHHYGDASYELYALSSDIGETTDLSSTQPERLMAMSRRLARELDRMDAQYSRNLNTGRDQQPVMPDLPTLDLDGDGISDLDEDANRNGLVDSFETDPDSPDTDGDEWEDSLDNCPTIFDPTNVCELAVPVLSTKGYVLLVGILALLSIRTIIGHRRLA
ncbi:MAG: sulfatase [Deltaproteobacteria bacterium]|nr:sulfatase [Deltaproteobacteria bacterium]